MKFLRTICLLGVTICLTGCFTLDSADVRPIECEHVGVGNYGWYRFNFIPLACGNASENPLLPWVFFRNDVTLDRIQRRFNDYAKFVGKKPVSMNYFTQESVLLELPGADIPIPIPYLLTYHEIQLSGVLK